MSIAVSVLEIPPTGANLTTGAGDQDCHGSKQASKLDRESEDACKAKTDDCTERQAKESSDNSNEKIAGAKQRLDKMDSSPSDKIPNPIRKSSTASKFKEKRPEPLKLNPNLNQDIPLDLSVKSAGNVPSGTLSSIFNLGPTNYLTTLETPRIQWQDNDALLTAGKARLFSSSTNASQQARISSLMGESPPITPNTPLMDMMFSPSGSNLRSSNPMPHSASLVLESPSTFESQKARILERWAQTSRTQIIQLRSSESNGFRRSCSTDNLNYSATNDGRQAEDDKCKNNHRLKPNHEESTRGTTNGPANQSKKNAISPLAIKSLSNAYSNNGSQDKFSYTNQQIASNLNEAQRSPTVISGQTGKSLTPTSVASATANLLNIHLNSPTGHSQSPVSPQFDTMVSVNNHNQRLPHKSPSFTSFEHEFSPLNTSLISTTLGQQQHSVRTSSINFSSPTLNSDPNNNYHRNLVAFQQQNLAPISSSATLNTPTLISPSQLKAGHLCFLQSPTLSPMSSVFDLPSPFIVLPPSTQSHSSISSKQYSPKMMGSPQISDKLRNTDSLNGSEMQVDTPNEVGNNVSKSCDALQTSSGTLDTPVKSDNFNTASSANDLSHLITPATKKINPTSRAVVQGENTDRGDDVEIEIDCDLAFRGDHKVVGPRPATVIPQICVSDHQLGVGNRDANQRAQHDSTCKRSPSPKSRRIKVKNYQNERAESGPSLADVHQRRVRAKVKTIAEDSNFDLATRTATSRNDVDQIAGNNSSANEVSTTQRAQFEQICSKTGANALQSRPGRPYPEMREWFPSSSHLLQTQAYTNGSGTTLGVRSSSAEPAVCFGLISTKAGQYSSSVTNFNNATLNCCQSTTHAINDEALSNSVQQLHYNSLSGANKLHEIGALNQTMVVGLNRPRINAINSNQQLQQQYSPSIAYYQQQQPQQHSTSAGELNRISDGSSCEQKPSIISASNYGTSARSNVNQFYQPQISQHKLMCQTQLSNQQAISSSLNSVDYILNGYQQIHTNQRRNLTENTACVEQMTRQPDNQASAVNVLCNDETCQRHMSRAHNLQGNSPTKFSTMAQQQHQGLLTDELSTNHSKFGSSIATSNINCSYQVDVESRSDSRSSDSLDFSSQFIDGGSRANSEASSNMTSKKYHCDQCSKSFTRSDMLTRHKRLHSGDRPFQCGECKQEFSRSDHLSTHMRTHTGEKPYKCKLCSYSACRKDMITRHLKVHSRNPHSNDCI